MMQFTINAYLNLLMIGLGESPHAHTRSLIQDLRMTTVPLFVLALDVLSSGEYILHRNPVLHKQTYLDVHHIQVLFQLLVGFDLVHHFSLQSLALWREGEGGR